MANEVTTRLVDLPTMISSPELLALRRISLGTINHPGMPARKYLPAGLTLTDERRGAIRSHIDKLRTTVNADASQPNQKARIGLLATMMMAYPVAGNAGEEAGKARVNAYLAALDDAPPWAIAEAIRKWHRGEGGDSSANYRFAPAPAELRYAVMQILQPAKQVISHLESMLSALTIERAMDPTPVIAEIPTQRPRLRVL